MRSCRGRNTGRNGNAVSFALIVMATLLILAATNAATQTPRTIGKIEVEGLERLTLEQVVALSQLRVGDVFNLAALNTAGQRLVDTGLFKKVGYRTLTAGNRLTIIFQVEESRVVESPVVFDNFIWFTDEELIAAIQREVPSFKGSAPDGGNITDIIRIALQNLLETKNVAGTVEYMPFLTLGGATQEHLFSVTGVPIPICSLHFPGAATAPEQKLIKSSAELTESDYSRKSAGTFPRYTLFPIYRELGQLRATFGAPIVKLNPSEACNGGVDLTIPVDEGPVYFWDKAVWIGNQTLSASELEAALGMKNGEVANGLKFDKGLHQITVAYGRKGRLDVQARPQPELDDTAKRVSYKIELKEGPEYRMGTLTIKGLSENDTRDLQARWQLKSGQTFDSGYPNQFLGREGLEVLQRIILGRQSQGKRPPEVSIDIEPNRQTLVVDVVVELKG